MYDAIVIGSGIGSLTTAGLLAGVAKKRVLVLEKHSTPGGLTHAFRRQGASWDAGLHYVGDMAPGLGLVTSLITSRTGNSRGCRCPIATTASASQSSE